MPRFDDRYECLLADLLDEPTELLGILSDVVNHGRIQAEVLPPEMVRSLASFDLVTFLFEKKPRRQARTWVYPTPLGLRVFATLERAAERPEEPPAATDRTHVGR